MSAAATRPRRDPGPAAPTTSDDGPGVDSDALLCALVLAPSTYSRNRFFQLYQDRELRLVRRRAAILRGLVRQFVKTAVEPRVEQRDGGFHEVTLQAPNLGYERRALLCELELSLFRYMHAKSLGRTADVERRAIEASLARLLPVGVAGG